MKFIILSTIFGFSAVLAGYLSYSGLIGSFFGGISFGWGERLTGAVSLDEDPDMEDSSGIGDVLSDDARASGATAFSDKLAPVYFSPSSIFIEGRGIDMNLVVLGVNEFGQLEVPTNPGEGGWYYRSAKAGEPGNLLVNAHYDDAHGNPAAFFNLKSVAADDKVVVVDSQGRYHYYRVTSIYYINIYDEDRIEKLLESEGVTLTLVTCEGVWLPAEGTYNQRLVVKAQLE